MNKTEQITKKFLQRFGILIRKYTPASSEEFRRIKLFHHHNINLVFDIGANKGQYATGIVDAGFKGQIVSFEPLTSMHQLLTQRAQHRDNWIIAPRCAIGSERGEADIHIAANKVSSTLKTMLESHVHSAPQSRIVDKETVEVIPLDEISSLYIKKESKLSIKIDVEGFEKEVISGAQQTFKQAIGVEMEISLIPLYAGQTMLLPETIAEMQAFGFRLVSITPGFTDFDTGEVLQCNGIFYK